MIFLAKSKVRSERKDGKLTRGQISKAHFVELRFYFLKLQLDGEYCFCDFDECNAHRCNTDFCSCGFSDPMHCRNITEGSYIQCRTCEGPSCENGEYADLKKCDHGEGSCFYGRVQTPDRHEVEIMRGCGDAFHGAKLEGCFDLKGFAGSDFTVS